MRLHGTSPYRNTRRWYTRFRLAALALVAVSVLMGATPQGQSYLRAALLVQATVSPPGEAFLDRLTREPTHQAVTIPLVGTSVQGRLYWPASPPPRSGLILSLGYPADIDDPQVNLLAERMARIGVAVLIPQLPGLMTGQLRSTDVDVLVASTQWLADQGDKAPLRVGMFGFCAGSSLALLASEDPRISNQIALIAVLGGYFDLPTLMRAVIAQGYLERGQRREWAPPRETLELFTWNMLRLVATPGDAAIIRQHLAEARSGPPPPGLSHSGILVLQGLTSDDPQTVDLLIAALPPEIHAEFTRLSPSAKLRQLVAPVFLMHDPDDPFMPRTEADSLAQALRQSGNPPRYAQFALFDHVRPRQDLGLGALWDGARLVFYLAPMIQTLE